MPRRTLPADGPLRRAPEGRAPDGGPPKVRIKQAPRQRPVAKPPNPRTPKLVRDAARGILQDLFAFFPDLPRPPRPGRS